jgi:hypothetical protein
MWSLRPRSNLDRRDTRIMDTLTQVELLWKLLPHPTPDHVVRLFARNHDQRFGDFARNPADIVRFIESSPGMNIYVAPNPTLCTTGVRHTANDVTHWSYILLDLDPVEEDALPFEALDEALLWLGEWMGRDLNPVDGRVITLDSGRGAQAWIRLQDIVLVNENETVTPVDGLDIRDVMTRKTARKAMGYWLKKLADKLGTYQGCRLDSCTSDLPRVMRCPGTVNIKTGRMASLAVATEEVHRGLAHLLVTGTPPRVFDEPEPGQLAPGAPWTAAFTKLTMKAQNYLTKGKEDPGRHETMWHTCKKLEEAGVSRVEARKALHYANNLLGPELALPDEQIETDLNQVYGRA